MVVGSTRSGILSALVKAMEQVVKYEPLGVTEGKKTVFHVAIVDKLGRFRAGTRDGGATKDEVAQVALKLKEVLSAVEVTDTSLVNLLGEEYGAVVVECANAQQAGPVTVV